MATDTQQRGNHPIEEWGFVPLQQVHGPAGKRRANRLTVVTEWPTDFPTTAAPKKPAAKNIRASKSHSDFSTGSGQKNARQLAPYDKDRPLPPLPLEFTKSPIQSQTPKARIIKESPSKGPGPISPAEAEDYYNSPPSATSSKFFTSEGVQPRPRRVKSRNRKPRSMRFKSKVPSMDNIRIKFDPPYSPFTPTVVLQAAGMQRATLIRRSMSMSEVKGSRGFSGFNFDLECVGQDQEECRRIYEKWAEEAEEIQVKLEVQLDDPILTPLIEAQKLEFPEIKTEEELAYLFPKPPAMPTREAPSAPSQTLQLPEAFNSHSGSHPKPPSTASSRSTMSLFTGSTVTDHERDGESEITDYADYGNECEDGHSTCASSIASESSEALSACSDNCSECDKSTKGCAVVVSQVDEAVLEGMPVPPSAPKTMRDSAAVLGIKGYHPILKAQDNTVPPVPPMPESIKRQATGAFCPREQWKKAGPSAWKGGSPGLERVERVGSWDLLYPLGTKGVVSRSRAPSVDESGSGRLHVVVEEPVRPSTAPETPTRGEPRVRFDFPVSREINTRIPTITHTTTMVPAASAAAAANLNLDKIKGFFQKRLNRPQLTEVERGRRNREGERKMGIYIFRRNVSVVKDNISQVKGELSASVKRHMEKDLEEVPIVPPPPAVAIQVERSWTIDRI